MNELGFCPEGHGKAFKGFRTRDPVSFVLRGTILAVI